jgi:hypothetical protein
MNKTLSFLFATMFFLTACGPKTVPPDIGKVWHEKEGPWEGTWTRRGDTNVFDAVWKNPQGEKIEDQVTFESVSDHQIVLFRKGTQGRYRGRLSDDGLRVDNGTADWFSPGDSWSATIEK